MPRTITPSQADQERLISELNSYQAAWRTMQARGLAFRDACAWILATHRLNDAAIACGMPLDTPDLEGWAAEAVASFLCAA